VPEEANLTTQTHSPLTWVIRLPQTKHTHSTSLFKFFFSFLFSAAEIMQISTTLANFDLFPFFWTIFSNLAAEIMQISTTPGDFWFLISFLLFSLRTIFARPRCCWLCGCGNNYDAALLDLLIRREWGPISNQYFSVDALLMFCWPINKQCWST